MVLSLRETAKPRKQCGMTLILRNKADPAKIMFRRVSCGCWHCEKCSPELRLRWLGHLGPLLLAVEQIYVSHIDKKDWRAATRRIYNRGGQSAIIEQSDGYLVVFTNVSVGEPITKSIALAVLNKAVAGAGTAAGKRPIHTSRGWGPPKEEGPTRKTWERVRSISATIKDARKAVQDMGGWPVSFFSVTGSGFVVDVPITNSQDKNEVAQLFIDSVLERLR